MAAMRDLQARAEALGATVTYMTSPPVWLMRVMKAAQAVPVIVNCKGVEPDKTPVILTLGELERLLNQVHP